MIEYPTSIIETRCPTSPNIQHRDQTLTQEA